MSASWMILEVSHPTKTMTTKTHIFLGKKCGSFWVEHEKYDPNRSPLQTHKKKRVFKPPFDWWPSKNLSKSWMHVYCIHPLKPTNKHRNPWNIDMCFKTAVLSFWGLSGLFSWEDSLFALEKVRNINNNPTDSKEKTESPNTQLSKYRCYYNISIFWGVQHVFPFIFNFE